MISKIAMTTVVYHQTTKTVLGCFTRHSQRPVDDKPPDPAKLSLRFRYYPDWVGGSDSYVELVNDQVNDKKRYPDLAGTGLMAVNLSLELSQVIDLISEPFLYRYDAGKIQVKAKRKVVKMVSRTMNDLLIDFTQPVDPGDFYLHVGPKTDRVAARTSFMPMPSQIQFSEFFKGFPSVGGKMVFLLLNRDQAIPVHADKF